MKSKLLFLLLFGGQYLTAQMFSEVVKTPPFIGINQGEIAFADVDDDGDMDMIASGAYSQFMTTKLYINNGNGEFIENRDSVFIDVFESAVAFADIDGDDDQDLIICGFNGFEKITKLYVNDGNGEFAEKVDAKFEGVSKGAVAFADVDGDDDQDLLLTGEADFPSVAKLYINDGSGDFTESQNVSFEAVENSSIAFFDVDGDNDQDVIILGLNNFSDPSSKLYINDGLGNFSESMGTPFEQIRSGSVAYSDIDNDGDHDIFIVGWNGDELVSKLYLNNGRGDFLEKLDSSFESVYASSVAFADVDGDNDYDLMIAGAKGDTQLSKLYINDGLGGFSESTAQSFKGARLSSLAFADLDSDNDQDLVITGNSGAINIASLYLNDGLGQFSEILPSPPFIGVSSSSISFSDIDGDNDQDVFIMGTTGNGRISNLYINDGLGNFSKVDSMLFEAPYLGDISFADIDGDNDQDLLITGEIDLRAPIAKLYKNDGNGNFSEMLGTPFERVWYSSVAFADIDGDNDQDLVITGKKEFSFESTKLYINDGQGNFSERMVSSLDDILSGDIAFSDIDGDNDHDILITGWNGSNHIAKLYVNDGFGNFSELSGSPLEGVSNSAVSFADIDGDNDPDVLITGRNKSDEPTANLYINDGKGHFSKVAGAPFEAVWTTSTAFADIDGDGDQDVLITGRNQSIKQISKLYINDGVGNFSEVINAPFIGVDGSAIAFSDIDGDDDPDVLITGFASSNGQVAKLYINERNSSPLNSNMNFEVIVYPNPVNENKIHITFDSKERGLVNLRVYDVEGKLQMEKEEIWEVRNQSLIIEISSLSRGLYFVKVSDGFRVGVQKFIID